MAPITARIKIENVASAYGWHPIARVRFGWTSYRRIEPDRVLQLNVMYSSSGHVRQADILRIVSGGSTERVAFVGAATKGKREKVLEWLGKAWELGAAPQRVEPPHDFESEGREVDAPEGQCAVCGSPYRATSHS